MAQDSQSATLASDDFAEIMAALAEGAVDERPRMFAIYGLNDRATRMILGWGLEYTEYNLCIYLEPPSHAMHLGNTAQQLLAGMKRIGDVHLVWLP